MIRTLLVCCCLLSSVGCSSLGISLYPTGHLLTPESEAVLEQAPSRAPLPRELDLSVVPVHYLQPGDVLLIEAVEFDENVRLPADQKVMPDGTLDLAGFGRLQVAGMTLEEAEAAIEQRLVAMQASPAQVNVRLLDGIERYYVLGEVQSPGAYPLVGHETVLDGILQAGGLTDLAAPCRILLARPTAPGSCRVVLPICYRQITQLGDTTTNYQLQPGDRIYIASRSCCEEWMFWKAKQSCDRCCGAQQACCAPQAVPQYRPVAVTLPASPPLPNWSQDPQLERPEPLVAQDEMIESTAPPTIDSSGESLPLRPTTEAAAPAIETVPRRPLRDGELDFEAPL
ncbi:polysaccharide biosynthesis/export family protein [Roseimaritima sediminicola]|uniref:polysaccharide biosynthesis/export family protein n=1 Tax=Roseimaritima sediminicola TaxID=2662066 RepID=UPI0012982CF4|nr:polysaccharide biosynthesis/export family protein [Roseimaritima sediminicola]